MATTTAKKNTSKTGARKPATRSTTQNGKVAPKRDAAEELQELFEDSLKDIYWAEKALTKALPKMMKNATSEKLKQAIELHITQTQEQVSRLEQVFNVLGKKAQAKKCDAMEGLIEEGEGVLEESEPGAVRDAGIIGAAQKVEHYEIATYGTLATWAKLLGHDQALELLLQTLEEEKQTDLDLSTLAKSEINLSAV